MGGHGGLNILPQKRWNVYNFDNREKVRKDEEAAARDEQQKREQTRRQDFEFRLQKLREARNLSSPTTAAATSASTSSNPNHINLFENFADFETNNNKSSNKSLEDKEKEERKKDGGKKRKREEPPSKVTISAEDEKYRLGYGLAGKGVKAPWYLSRSEGLEKEGGRGPASGGDGGGEGKRTGGKKSIEELREERMRRETKEKERERALLASKNKGFSRRRM